MKNLVVVLFIISSMNVLAEVNADKKAKNFDQEKNNNQTEKIQITQGRAIASDEIMLERDLQERRRSERFERMQNRRIK